MVWADKMAPKLFVVIDIHHNFCQKENHSQIEVYALEYMVYLYMNDFHWQGRTQKSITNKKLDMQYEKNNGQSLVHIQSSIEQIHEGRSEI